MSTTKFQLQTEKSSDKVRYAYKKLPDVTHSFIVGLEEHDCDRDEISLASDDYPYVRYALIQKMIQSSV